MPSYARLRSQESITVGVIHHRSVLAMGNSVAPVGHSVVAHHKDSECAAVLHRSGAECA